MTPIDWQAYLDGSLGPEDTARANQLLEVDPRAKSEFEGLKALRDHLSGLAHLEPIPFGRLESGMRSVRRVKRIRWTLGTAAAAVALTAFGLAFTDYHRKRPVRFETSAPLATLCVTNASEVADFVGSHAGFSCRSFDPRPVATVNTVSYGAGWVCYLLDANRKSVGLYVRKHDGKLDWLPQLSAGGYRYSVCGSEQTPGIGWEQGSFEFFLIGDSSEALARLANELREKTEAIVRDQ